MTENSGSETSGEIAIATRERLLEAAIDVFGRYGYDAATTRVLAQAAGANIASISYYFESKEGLYRAVVSSIVEKIQEQVAGSDRTLLQRRPSGPRRREQALELLEQILERIIDFMVGSPEAPRVARIIIREQLYPSAAYDVIFIGFMEPMLERLAQLIVVITGRDSLRTATLRAMALFGQVMAFRVARETLVRALDCEGYSQRELEEVRQVILEHTRSALRSFFEIEPGEGGGP